MKYATAAGRLGIWKAVAGVAGVLATSAVFAGTAGATVYVVPLSTNSQTNGAALASAITSANASGPNTIVVPNEVLAPTTAFPAITGNVRITGDHALQAPGGQGPIISGSQTPTDTVLLTVSPGGTLTTEGVNIRAMGTANATNPGMVVQGTYVAYNTSINGNQAVSALQVALGGTATLNESGVTDNLGVGVDNQGTLNLNNVTVRSNANGINQAGTLNVENSLLTNNASTVFGTNCTVAATTSDHSFDSDGTCVTTTDTTSKFGTAAAPLTTSGTSPTGPNGGPVVSVRIAATSAAVGLGNPANCGLSDVRFFTRPAGATPAACDAGEFQHDAVQDTTPASCTVTALLPTTGPPFTQQQVTVQDTKVGLGPEGGSISDPINATGAQVGNNQGDTVDGLTISNGSVAAGPFSSSGPSTAGTVLTATKTTAGTPTSWSFTLTNWAGVTKFCK